MTPSPLDPHIRWAVYLGCTTARRLSICWGIPMEQACKALNHAVESLHISRVGRGVFSWVRK